MESGMVVVTFERDYGLTTSIARHDTVSYAVQDGLNFWLKWKLLVLIYCSIIADFLSWGHLSNTSTECRSQWLSVLEGSYCKKGPNSSFYDFVPRTFLFSSLLKPRARGKDLGKRLRFALFSWQPRDNVCCSRHFFGNILFYFIFLGNKWLTLL